MRFSLQVEFDAPDAADAAAVREQLEFFLGRVTQAHSVKGSVVLCDKKGRSVRTPISVYTDGGCISNPDGPGGWGVVIVDPRKSNVELSGGETSTTNNRMELMAAIKALEHIEPDLPLVVHSDSQYVIKGITEWIHGWRKRGWKTASDEQVKNKDLWERLYGLTLRHEINWRWVKGHSGNPGNEQADHLATQGMKQAASRVSAGG